MYKVYVKGTATINNRLRQDFEEVLLLENTGLGGEKYEVLQKMHPDWESINVYSYDCDGKWYSY